MKALENLKAVLCDPEGRASINGSAEDLKIIDESLAQIQLAQEDMIYIPGILKCPKCNFGLVKKYINANSGNISANRTPDVCANGCGPMWRVTWKDRCKENTKMLENIFLENNKLKEHTAKLVEALESIKDYERIYNYPQHEMNHALLVEIPHIAFEALADHKRMMEGENE